MTAKKQKSKPVMLPKRVLLRMLSRSFHAGVESCSDQRSEEVMHIFRKNRKYIKQRKGSSQTASEVFTITILDTEKIRREQFGDRYG